MSDDAMLKKTYILDAENVAEMTRLIELDQMTSRGMGGPLRGLPSLPANAKVLDIACGPGGWVLDVAFANPQVEVAGVDISTTMMAYANARAQTQQVHNASFGVMDVTGPLDFSDNSFDLINGRLLSSFLMRETWPRLLKECLRLLRPGGILRITETDSGGVTNSLAFDQLNNLLFQATQRAGYGFGHTGQTTFSITPVLARLLRQAGYTKIQQQAHGISTAYEAESWGNFAKNTEIVFDGGALPLISSMGLASEEELAELHQRMVQEMNQEDFAGTWYLLSVWGVKPA